VELSIVCDLFGVDGEVIGGDNDSTTLEDEDGILMMLEEVVIKDVGGDGGGVEGLGGEEDPQINGAIFTENEFSH